MASAKPKKGVVIAVAVVALAAGGWLVASNLMPQPVGGTIVGKDTSLEDAKKQAAAQPTAARPAAAAAAPALTPAEEQQNKPKRAPFQGFGGP